MNPLYRELDWNRHLDEDGAAEAAEPYRSAADRDYARLIHSPSFRRLQGKTQLFPSIESDYFRNRLTHSLEVAQIAESIARKINYSDDYFREHRINTKVTAIAGLAHDIGHPPFGHNGEKALDDCMKGFGGFEGNAQTLRIITTLEKKRHALEDGSLTGISEDGEDMRHGLNLSSRVIASILKYDSVIRLDRTDSSTLMKGYYKADEELVLKIKKDVCGDVECPKFKTIECWIMDVADDIAYSTYDIDDAFKGGFLNPLDILSASDELIERVAARVSERLNESFTAEDATEALYELFKETIVPNVDSSADANNNDLVIDLVASYTQSKYYAENGYFRSDLTSILIDRFLEGIEIEHNLDCPALTKVFLRPDTARLVEFLKVFSFEATIMSPRLKVAEARGYEIVKTIFTKLDESDGNLLFPQDFRSIYNALAGQGTLENKAAQKRVICDFIAGMTDRYAVEFYGRLVGESHKTIFKPF
jgi:dGTPase